MAADKDAFTICWEAADGYAGKSRPQYLDISADDVRDAGSIGEAMEMMWQAVQEDFERCVTPEALNEDDFFAWAEALLEAGEPDDA